MVFFVPYSPGSRKSPVTRSGMGLAIQSLIASHQIST